MPTPNPSSGKKDFLGAIVKLQLRGRPKPEDHECYVCGRSFDRESEFKDAVCAKEYVISGACQKCQDDIFAEPEEEKSASYE